MASAEDQKAKSEKSRRLIAQARKEIGELLQEVRTRKLEKKDLECGLEQLQKTVAEIPDHFHS